MGRMIRGVVGMMGMMGMMGVVGMMGCTRPAARTVGPEPVEVGPQREVREEGVEEPRYQVRLRPSLEGTPRLDVEVVAHGMTERVWKMSAVVSAEVRDLAISDREGAVAFTQRREGLGLVVTLGRAPRGPLKLNYGLVLAPPGPLPVEVPAALTMRLDRTHMLVSGEELLLLPAEPQAQVVALSLELVPEGPLLRLASSLGAEPGTPGRARVEDLRHAVFLAGTTGHALLRGPAGEDDFAWTGEPTFDLRWSAAETAGARTAVDLYFGAVPEEVVRFTGLFVVDFEAEAEVQVVPRGPGLYVGLAGGARWHGPTRLAVAQGLVHRWVGGRLRLGDPGEPPETHAWFAEGYARFVAREVLFELGTLSMEEYAEEVNGHQAELALSSLRGAPVAEVAAAAAQGDRKAQALMTARGVLHATRVDAQIRGRREGRSLRDVMRALVAEARAGKLATLPLRSCTEKLAAELGPAEVEVLRDAVLGAGTLRLPADALGLCFVRVPRVYTRFELGFDAAASQAEMPARVRGLRAGGPAARAGVREGELLLALTFQPDDAKTSATLALERGGREVTVSYRPAGESVRGQAWQRRPGVDEALCAR